MEQKSLSLFSLLYIVLLSSILLLGDLVGFFHGYKNFRSFVGTPIATFYQNTKLTFEYTFFSMSHGTSLKHENVALRQRILELEGIVGQYQLETQQDVKLHQFYESTQSTKYGQVVNAQVLDTYANRLPGKLLLNKGLRDGLEVGMPVVFGSFYVGYLSEVNTADSTCTTYLVPNQEFIGYIPTRKLTGIIKVGISDITLGDLLASENVALHDVVTIKREGYSYLFTLGAISQVPTNNGSAERKAKITGSVPVTEISFVTIVKK